MVTGLDVAHLRAYLLDDAGRLVPQHDRQGVRKESFDKVQIGVAEAGHRGAQQDLVRRRLTDTDLLDYERLVGFI